MIKKNEQASSSQDANQAHFQSKGEKSNGKPLFSESNAENIWLAGLAIYQKAQEEGGKAVENYFKEGQALTEKMQSSLQENISKLLATGNQVLKNTVPGIPNISQVNTEKLPFLSDNLAEKIWQAGIAIFQNAQQDGTKVFDQFCKEGKVLAEKMQSDTQDHLKTYANSTKQLTQLSQANEVVLGEWGALTQIFDTKVANALQRLGVPTKTVVATLETKIITLEEKIAELQNQILALEQRFHERDIQSAGRANQSAPENAQRSNAKSQNLVPNKKTNSKQSG